MSQNDTYPRRAPSVFRDQRSKWLPYLIFWLAAFPVAFVVSITTRNLDLPDALRALINIVSLLIGVYGLLGWLPLVFVLSNISNSRPPKV